MDGSTPFITRTVLMKTFKSTPLSHFSITIVCTQLKSFSTFLACIYIYNIYIIMIFFGKTGNMEILKPLLTGILFYKIFKQFFKVCKSYPSLFIINWAVFFFIKKLKNVKIPPKKLKWSGSTNIIILRKREFHTKLQFHLTNNNSEHMYSILQYQWIWSNHKLELDCYLRHIEIYLHP